MHTHCMYAHMYIYTQCMYTQYMYTHCMYIIHTCTHNACTHIHVHTYMYTHTCTRIHVHAYMYMHTCTCIHVHRMADLLRSLNKIILVLGSRTCSMVARSDLSLTRIRCASSFLFVWISVEMALFCSLPGPSYCPSSMCFSNFFRALSRGWSC